VRQNKNNELLDKSKVHRKKNWVDLRGIEGTTRIKSEINMVLKTCIQILFSFKKPTNNQTTICTDKLKGLYKTDYGSFD